MTVFARDGATIYYTMNGDDPTTESTQNGVAPLSISFRDFRVGASVTVKAIAAMDGFRASPIRTARFTIFERDVDTNDNGFIDIDNLNMLYNIRFNLEGTSYKTGANDEGSTVGASPQRTSGM